MAYFPCKSDRINWIDYYKAFSIFLIVVGHSVFQHIQLLYFIYLFNVPLFFFISGFLEKTTPCDLKDNLLKVTYTLVIPYFIWNGLCIIYY
ncbi:MAG: acyltransferase family protein, partial [Duncaniella sp.]|nr:acyltransferase family protein [Duncaniella sp.]